MHALARNRFDHWRRNLSGPECATTQETAADTARWRRWESERDVELQSGQWDREAHSDRTWSRSAGRDFHVDDVKEAIARGRNGTATSPADDVSYTALKAAGPRFLCLLAVFFTAVLRSGDVPQSWVVGFISWITKKGRF